MADVWKYPKDLYDVAVDWAEKSILPPGASIESVSITITNSGGK